MTAKHSSSESISSAQCRVTAIRSQFKHCVHAYQGADAWDQAGHRLLYMGCNDATSDSASIVLRDMSSGEETILAQTNHPDFHVAAKQRWALDDAAVLFKVHLDDGRPGIAMADVDRPGKIMPLQWAAGRHLRQVIDHGHQAVVHTDEDEAGPARIEWLDLHQQTTRTLLTVDRALEQLPVALQDSQARYIFHHPVVNHDQSRMFCKLMKIDTNDRPKFGAFYTMDLRSDTIQCLGDRISGHPFWMTDGQYILNIKHPHDGSENRHLVRVNADTGKDDRIIDLPIEGPGHPAQSPDGQWIVTDAFTDNGLESPIYLINLNTGVAREILRLNHLFRPTDHQGGPSPITRGQPHPVWSPCGSKILVNYNHAGSHFGLLLLEAMFS